MRSEATELQMVPAPYPGAGGRATSWTETETVHGVETIFDAAINTCVWRRPGVACIELGSGLRRTETAQVVGPNDASPGAVLAAWQDARWISALEEDLVSLVELFSILADTERVGVRIGLTDRQMCPRFHVDRVTLRLVTTLAGPGTEFLDDLEVDRRFLGRGAGGRPDERSGLLRPGAVVHRAAPRDVVLLKGELWPDNEGRGAVHRSPALAEGQWRLVVTLDELP
jgi:hypothetical protein